MSVTKEQILSDIREMLSETHPNIQISMETFLEYGSDSYLDMTSIEIVQFILDVEEKYGIIVDISERYYTVGDVICGIIGYLEEKHETQTKDTYES